MKSVAHLLVAAAAASFCTAVPAQAGAGAYPEKPIKIVIPYSAGGGTDQYMRIVSKRVSEKLKQPIMIINKPGGSTVIGVNSVISAEPDGYTLLVSTNTSYTLIPYVMSPQPYSPEASLDYVGVVGETAMVLTAHSSMPDSLATVVDNARKKPEGFSYATYGVGSSTHLAGEVFMNDTNTKFQHIPYKGVEAVTALAGGQVNFMVDGVNAASAMIKAGKTKALVVLQHERSEFLPDTPTLTEAGYPQASASKISYVMSAPKGTPKPIIDKLHVAFSEALRDDDVLQQIKTVQTSPAYLGPEQTQEFVRKQTASFKEIVEKKGIRF
jgi:tripartite-type tricarboxylate transporter receptor subunit TctC